jgi:hypothetical protein
MTTDLVPVRVGRLREPAGPERQAFRDQMIEYRQRVQDAYDAAEALTRATDQAAVYTRYGAEVPKSLRDQISDLDKKWEAARCKIPYATRRS